MELSKKNILSLIKKIDINNVKVLNVNIFGSEVLLDLETNNPTLQSKKNIENKIRDSLNENFGSDLISKFNFIIKKKMFLKKQSLEVKSQELIMFWQLHLEKEELENQQLLQILLLPFQIWALKWGF